MSSTNELQEEANILDSKFQTFNDLFKFPTFKSMGLIPSPTSDKSLDSTVNYFCGNSLGLMPSSTPKAINDELDAWSDRAVESHFRHRFESEGKTPWMDIDLPVVPLLAPVVGAKDTEVACMGTLTMNLNSLLCSFYKPTSKKFKILFEKHAFPSDYYALLNLAKLNGYDENALIQIEPREGEYNIRTKDIVQLIKDQNEEIALICLPGIQYYTGQYFDMKTITEIGHQYNCTVGWDLAHAVGNVDLKLHDWNVDFAVWCSYKYLNSGPGAIGGIFVHENHTKLTGQDWKPRLAGWWGNNADKRFKMMEAFNPIESALGYRQSNPSVIDVVSLKSSLEIFQKCGGIDTLRSKSIELTNYMEELLKASPYYRSISDSKELENKGGEITPHFIILTPENPLERGSQLSVLFKPHHDSEADNIMEKISNHLNSNGCICDERRPDAIRLAPTALYNSFKDCFDCVKLFNEGFEKL